MSTEILMPALSPTNTHVTARLDRATQPPRVCAASESSPTLRFRSEDLKLIPHSLGTRSPQNDHADNQQANRSE
jgi:hypothetical protein